MDYSPWGCKISDKTQRLNSNNKKNMPESTLCPVLCGFMWRVDDLERDGVTVGQVHTQ